MNIVVCQVSRNVKINEMPRLILKAEIQILKKYCFLNVFFAQKYKFLSMEIS